MELKDIISSGILELYSLGLTSEEENRQVIDWIKQFPEITNELNAIESAVEKYAEVHSVQPDSSVKEKILERIAGSSVQNELPLNGSENKQSAGAKVYRIPAIFKWAAAASVILLLGSLILNYSYFNKLRTASVNLQLTQNELNRQKEIAAAMTKDMDVVTDKSTLPVMLNGTPRAPNAVAKIFWIKNTGEVYVDPNNLPQPSAGRQYQLWAIVDGKPVDAGMISTQRGLYKIQKMKSFGKADAFAITLEKTGGSPTPTMEEMYVISKI